MIDRDVRRSLLHVIDFLKSNKDFLSVNDIIDFLELKMLRRYDRRSIYKHLDVLQEFEQIETKYTAHNTRLSRWRDESIEGRNGINLANVRDFRKAL